MKYIKKIVAVVFVFIALNSAMAKNIERLDLSNVTYLENEKYGDAERNTFDIIMPNSTKPVALVIYIHEGGFEKGDKKAAYKRENEIQYFLKHNIAFATINYRFYKSDDSLGVKVCLDDVQAAIQYFKFNDKKFNIDKQRVACYGVSAGAGSSLYFALNDDLAQPDAQGPAAESTKIVCAGAIHTQATYDVFKWKKFLPYMSALLPFKRKMVYKYASNFYGYPDYKSFKPYRKEIPQKFDMLNMVDSEDPPIYLYNSLTNHFPKDLMVLFHHKKHAIVMKKALNKANVENYCYTGNDDVDYSVQQFIVDNLN